MTTRASFIAQLVAPYIHERRTTMPNNTIMIDRDRLMHLLGQRGWASEARLAAVAAAVDAAHAKHGDTPPAELLSITQLEDLVREGQALTSTRDVPGVVARSIFYAQQKLIVGPRTPAPPVLLTTDDLKARAAAAGVLGTAKPAEDLLEARDVYAAWCLALRHRFHDNHPASTMSLFHGQAPPPPKDFAFLTHIEQFAWQMLTDSINHNDSVQDALRRDQDAAAQVAAAGDRITALATFMAPAPATDTGSSSWSIPDDTPGSGTVHTGD